MNLWFKVVQCQEMITVTESFNQTSEYLNDPNLSIVVINAVGGWVSITFHTKFSFPSTDRVYMLKYVFRSSAAALISSCLPMADYLIEHLFIFEWCSGWWFCKYSSKSTTDVGFRNSGFFIIKTEPFGMLPLLNYGWGFHYLMIFSKKVNWKETPFEYQFPLSVRMYGLRWSTFTQA
jgi:hypothetical protein